jgi:long-chain acyl-CoA synthetase
VALSEPFQAVAEKIGVDALEKWCDEKVNVVAGDITFDHLGLSPEDYAELTKNDPVDVILHCAGNVNFNPPLDQALSVNTMGVGHKLELAKAAGCGIVHMSTCFVAGEVDGPVPESDDDTIVGYTPSGKAGFDPERELADCLTLIEEIRKRAQAQAMESQFRDEAKEELTRPRGPLPAAGRPEELSQPLDRPAARRRGHRPGETLGLDEHLHLLQEHG